MLFLNDSMSKFELSALSEQQHVYYHHCQLQERGQVLQDLQGLREDGGGVPLAQRAREGSAVLPDTG